MLPSIVASSIGSGADVEVTGDVNVEAEAELDADGHVLAASGGIGANGASRVRATSTRSIMAAIEISDRHGRQRYRCGEPKEP